MLNYLYHLLYGLLPWWYSSPVPVAALLRCHHPEALGEAPLTKKIRFEIFKRDFFTCQYCGNRPPDIVLEVDHIDPRANGGTDDPINLVTSCFGCNRGKSDRVLNQRINRPDADMEFLACQQEISEAKRFLDSKKELDQIRERLVDSIQVHWLETLATEDSVPSKKIILEWLMKFSPQEITEAIDRMLPAIRRKPYSFRDFEDYIKYLYGIMRNRREAVE